MIPYPDPTLAHGEIELRPWALTDLTLVEEAANDPRLLPGTTLPRAYTRNEGVTFIERQWNRHQAGEGVSLCITCRARPVGCATLMLRGPAVADLGYWLVERARGTGIGTQAIALLVEWALALTQLEAVEAFVAEENVPSRRLLERLGFHDFGIRRHQVSDLDANLRMYRREGAVLGGHS